MQLFDVGSCVGQGDSLSAYLFIIALEVLLVIMSDEEIKGNNIFAVENEVLRITAIANDLTNFLHVSRSQFIAKLINFLPDCFKEKQTIHVDSLDHAIYTSLNLINQLRNRKHFSCFYQVIETRLP